VPQKPKKLDASLSDQHRFGVELRDWREKRGLTQTQAGTLVHVSGSYIGKIEKGDRPCPEELARALDDALQAGGALTWLWERLFGDADNTAADADRSASEPRIPGISFPGAVKLSSHALMAAEGTVDPVQRRAFLGAGSAAALAVGPLAALMLPPGTGPTPPSVRQEDIEQLRTATAALSGWDNAYGGVGFVREAAVGQLHWAARLLHVDCAPALRPELFTAVGRLAVVVGAAAFDAYVHDDARKLLAFAVACAEEANNWHLRANACNWRARQEIWCGDPDAGLTHAEVGLARSDRLTPREMAMLHNARARALAKMGRAQETLAAIGISDEVFTRARPNEDVSWMSYYDNAQHHGDTAHALYDLAVNDHHDPRHAAARFQVAIEEHGDGYVRSRAISGTKLASLTMLTGDPAEATAQAHRALDDVGRVRSKRAADDVRALRQAAIQHAHDSDVAELRDRITESVLV
jgi:transcriptional regulator with XRE-family HTH domain